VGAGTLLLLSLSVLAVLSSAAARTILFEEWRVADMTLRFSLSSGSRVKASTSKDEAMKAGGQIEGVTGGLLARL
jgi:hypothetical protein